MFAVIPYVSKRRQRSWWTFHKTGTVAELALKPEIKINTPLANFLGTFIGMSFSEGIQIIKAKIAPAQCFRFCD